jgi:hypothetical protein
MYYIEAVIFGLTLMALAVCLNIGFKPPSQKERLQAIGSSQGFPSMIQRAMDPGDRLAEHEESDQTVMDFIRAGPNKPDALWNSIYLQTLGCFRENGSLPLETLRSCAGAYFAMPVKILPGRDIGRFKFTWRINPYNRNRQIFTRDVLISLEHCIFFRCIMNGSNHLDESDARPMFFCPVCLRKHWFEVVTTADSRMKIYFGRRPCGGRKSHRWWPFIICENGVSQSNTP